MNSRPQGVDPQVISGRRASAVSEIVSPDGQAVALQVAFADGSSLLCTVWTDWSLVFEQRADQGLPDYFWPVEDHSVRPIVRDIPAGGLEIVSVEVSVDEVGTTMGVAIELDGHLVAVRSFGGELELSVGGEPGKTPVGV